ncbi:hypothetical protein BU16DRAFT_74433 [Lophium mytilinum]|uniref:Uncharacterized protein n=1 Tax=Lophium mytilinum TaxID=390894 RepID=A0A6A6QLJ9_9PEZI|nr:hypothetical protein BU16DRAFT_74433 [Lophium mytilinum]
MAENTIAETVRRNRDSGRVTKNTSPLEKTACCASHPPRANHSRRDEREWSLLSPYRQLRCASPSPPRPSKGPGKRQEPGKRTPDSTRRILRRFLVRAVPSSRPLDPLLHPPLPSQSHRSRVVPPPCLPLPLLARRRAFWELHVQPPIPVHASFASIAALLPPALLRKSVPTALVVAARLPVQPRA